MTDGPKAVLGEQLAHPVEARYRSENMHDPVLLATVEDADRLIDTLLAGPPMHDAAHLLSRARPRLASGFWDHELYVGVSRDVPVGALAFAAPEVGRIVSAGGPDSRTGVAYFVAGHWTEFPDHSEVPVALVREAVREFLCSGGQVPSCIA